MREEPIRIVVAGCAYAGISAVVNLLDVCSGKRARHCYLDEDDESMTLPRNVDVEIHIIDERDGYLHLIGCPLAFSSSCHAEKMWVKFDEIPALQHPSVRRTQGSIVKVTPDQHIAKVKTIKGETNLIAYDYFIAATGLKRKFPVIPHSVTQAEYLQETGGHIAVLKAALDGIVIIGGGAVGIEMAAELKVVEPSSQVTLIHSRDKLLSAEPLPDEFKDAAFNALREIGVEVVLGRGRMTNISQDTVHGKSLQKLTLQDGTTLTASHVVNAVSTQVPVTAYLPDAVLESERFVKINPL